MCRGDQGYLATQILGALISCQRKTMKHASNYTCTEYRQEMILLGLKRQLEAPELPEAQRIRIAEKINELERQMGMD